MDTKIAVKYSCMHSDCPESIVNGKECNIISSNVFLSSTAQYYIASGDENWLATLATLEFVH